MFGKEIEFLQGEIKQIKIKKFFPIIAYGIRIHPKNVDNNYYFWYVGLHFNKLLNAIRECGWPIQE